MPWTCPACARQIPVDDAGRCPDCGGAKTSWTVQADVTRAMRVSTARLRLLVGAARAATELAGPPRPADAELVEGPGWVLLKERARELLERGLRPPPAELVFARVKAKADEPPLLQLALHRRQGESLEVESEEQAMARAPDDPQVWELPLLLVGGAGEAPAVAGVQVLDVGDAPAAAAALEVRYGKRSRELELRVAGQGEVRLRILGPRWLPLPYLGATLESESGQELGALETDLEGRVCFGDLPHGRYQVALSLAERRLRVPVSWAKPERPEQELLLLEAKQLLGEDAPSQRARLAAVGYPGEAAALEANARAFQEDQRLSVDGIIGPLTGGRLRALYGA